MKVPKRAMHGSDQPLRELQRVHLRIRCFGHRLLQGEKHTRLSALDTDDEVQDIPVYGVGGAAHLEQKLSRRTSQIGRGLLHRSLYQDQEHLLQPHGLAQQERAAGAEEGPDPVPLLMGHGLHHLDASRAQLDDVEGGTPVGEG